MVMAQMAMVMNLDKCIGCHTCSVTCKQAWTNRRRVAEYVWFNNVETRPGQGYPRHVPGPGELARRLDARPSAAGSRLKAGCRFKQLLNIFANPDLPTVSRTTTSPGPTTTTTLAVGAAAMRHTPVARPKSLITGRGHQGHLVEPTGTTTWAAGPSRCGRDPVLAKVAEVSEKVELEFEQTFMFYLPRICEHCLNPACVASCPSGAIYKRAEDGIVLVDQDKCRGWRQCVTGLPLQEDLLQPQDRQGREVHVLLPARRGRAPHGVLGDLRRAAALHRRDAATTPTRCWKRLRSPTTRTSTASSSACSSTRTIHGWSPKPNVPASHPNGLRPPRRSPVYRLIVDYQVALPAASGVPDACRWSGTSRRCRPWWTSSRRPVTTARTRATCSAPSTRCVSRWSTSPSCSPPVSVGPVRASLQRLAAMRAYMRSANLGEEFERDHPESVRLSGEEIEAMYRLPAIAKYQDRYVVPRPGGGSDAHPPRRDRHRLQPGR